MAHKNFTYLLGAGASANSVPVVNKMAEKVKVLYDYLKHSLEFSIVLNGNYNFLTDLEWFYQKGREHYSIDTYAKKLFLQNKEDELICLKKMLSCYLILVQGYNYVDLRYDAFFASLLTKDSDKNNSLLPHNINVLSWNYDYQLELSISGFLGTNNIRKIEEFLQSRPNGIYRPLSSNLFTFLNLNGNVSSYIREVNNELFISDFKSNITQLSEEFLNISTVKISPESEKSLWNNVLEIYNKYTNSPSSIYFAWEKHPSVQNQRVVAKEIANNTEILIVIGYSFPVFNREIDREIINNMKNLEKIYFQIPEDNIDSVIVNIPVKLSHHSGLN